MTQEIGRYCELNKIPEIKDLKKGMDFRGPAYRREVFLRFYEFHLKYNSHPGGVYFAMPWLANHFNMTMEDKLWMAFINGCSQNIITTSIIMEQFPSFKKCNVAKLEEWWNANHQNFKAGSGWDSDRKYFKIGRTGFPQCVASYKKAIGKKTQEEFFLDGFQSNQFKNFDRLWDRVRGNFLSFGRLSCFSYSEYLRIVGIPVDCSSLFLDDISGSKSHRNGLCKVLGRDDLDWWKQDTIKYEKETLEWLAIEGEKLLSEAKMRINHKDVSYFTLESTFCNYKSWHRPDRRYPNVYMDMMHDRIKYAEWVWHKEFDLFWKMREECLPKYLRLESNPNDPGLCKEKQNWYRLTGQPIMMSRDFPCFDNPFDQKCWQETQGLEAFL